MKSQKVYIGKDSLCSLGKVLSELMPQKVLLVHGKKSYAQCGAKEKIHNLMANFKAVKVMEFSEFCVNPDYNDLQKALLLCEEIAPDVIIGIGGGSALDIAKLLRFFYSYDGSVEDGVYKQIKNLIPLIAIPTTSGTGAEATHFAVVYKDKVKYSVDHDDVLPDIAVIYPPFTYENPPYLTACTGFDALAQGIEAFWNKNATDESDAFAKKAVELIYPNLPLAVNSPTEDVRDKISEGAYWAGKAINITKTTAPHAFSYPFTSYYGYPHGHAVALTFATIAKYNMTILCHTKRVWISKLISNCDDKESISEILRKYIVSLGLTLVDNEYNIDLILSNINVNRLLNNPFHISSTEATEIIRDVLEN